MAVDLPALGRAVKQAQWRNHRALDSALAAAGTTLAQWDAVVQRLPFPDEASSDPSHLVLYCWDGAPARTDFDPSPYGRESVAFAGHETYAYYPDGIGRSKLTLPVMEKATGRSGTARNEHRPGAAAARPRARLTSVAS